MHLEGFKASYKDHCPKNSITIGRKIIEHFIELFILKKMPMFVLRDETEDTLLDLGTICQNEFCIQSQTDRFSIRKKRFVITHLLVSTGAESEHKISFCTNDRTVKSEKANKHIPNLQASLTAGDKSVPYSAYVSGKFLNERASAERTGFDIAEQPGEMEYPDDLSWQEIMGMVSTKAKAFLHPLTNPINEAKKQQIREFVHEKHREYKPILKNCEKELDEIPAGLPDDKLDLELYRVQQGYEQRLKEEAIRLLSQKDSTLAKLEDYKKKFERFLDKWNEFGIATCEAYCPSKGHDLIYSRLPRPRRERKISPGETNPRGDSAHELDVGRHRPEPHEPLDD